MIETVATAAAAFAATNIDDLLVLSVLFARRDEHFHGRQIVVGQYLGFSVLVGASIAVSAGLLALPSEAIGLLGLIPFGLGVRGLVRARGGESARPAAGLDGSPERGAMTTVGVASITVSNGADNIAVYAPLFATIGADGFATTVVVFGVLVGIWCLAGRLIGTTSTVVRVVDWAGDYAIPVVLMGLGIFIIVKSGLLDAIFG